jgi:two-component system OmpR family response regulator
MYAEFLVWCGYRVEEAGDGEAAFAIAVSVRPDVIVTGTRLTKMDGYTLCARLRAHAGTATTPIIVLTSDGFPHQMQRAALAGADTVLITPCLPDTLHDVITQAVSSTRMRKRSPHP